MKNLKSRIDAIMKVLPPSFEKLGISNDPGNPSYIQLVKEDVEEAQKNFITLVDEVLGTNYSGEEIHRRGIIGRVIDDSGNKDLYQTWYRFMCIDDNYKEWQQPYYAINEQTKSICVNKTNPQIVSYLRDIKLEKILVESELQKSIKNLINVKNDQKVMDDFAHRRYDEEYPRDSNSYGYHHYDTFKVIDENTIRVFFKYGAGDYDYDGSFDVDMRPYYREEKINLLDI